MQTNQPTLPVSTSQSNETELTGDPEKDKKIKNLRKVCIKIFVCHNLSEDFHKGWNLKCCYSLQQCLIVGGSRSCVVGGSRYYFHKQLHLRCLVGL